DRHVRDRGDGASRADSARHPSDRSRAQPVAVGCQERVSRPRCRGDLLRRASAGEARSRGGYHLPGETAASPERSLGRSADLLPLRQQRAVRLSAGVATTLTVIPAKAGIQGHCPRRLPWTPAFAGVTDSWSVSLRQPALLRPVPDRVGGFGLLLVLAG